MIERIGRDESLRRDLFFLHVTDLEHLPSDISVGSRLVCLIAWDARDAAEDDLAIVAKKLVDARCAYACCWGPDCERVHDAVDLASSMTSVTEGRDAFVTTTWHAGEPLSEAIWFVLQCTPPDDAHMADCDATLAICIGAAAWAAQIRSAFSDPAEFLRTADDGR